MRVKTTFSQKSAGQGELMLLLYADTDRYSSQLLAAHTHHHQRDHDPGIADVEGAPNTRRHHQPLSGGCGPDGSVCTDQEYTTAGIDEHVLAVANDREAGHHRYRQLLRAVNLAQVGEQLLATGEQFWDEAEFRFTCCAAEFCEEAGYDRTFPMTPESVLISRQVRCGCVLAYVSGIRSHVWCARASTD
eukprot:COSAG01_NODE_6992_length_3401_cov_1.741672_2_plen_189_part_00